MNSINISTGKATLSLIMFKEAVNVWRQSPKLMIINHFTYLSDQFPTNYHPVSVQNCIKLVATENWKLNKFVYNYKQL